MMQISLKSQLKMKVFMLLRKVKARIIRISFVTKEK